MRDLWRGCGASWCGCSVTLVWGCFSDRVLDEKYYELEVLDRRISAVKSKRFYLRTRGGVGSG